MSSYDDYVSCPSVNKAVDKLKAKHSVLDNATKIWLFFDGCYPTHTRFGDFLDAYPFLVRYRDETGDHDLEGEKDVAFRIKRDDPINKYDGSAPYSLCTINPKALMGPHGKYYKYTITPITKPDSIRKLNEIRGKGYVLFSPSLDVAIAKLKNGYPDPVFLD